MTLTEDGQIVVSHLTKHYRKVKAVDDLSFAVRSGPGDRIPRPQRRRKNHHTSHDPQPGHPDRGEGDHRWAELLQTSRTRCARWARSSKRPAAHKGRTGRNHLRIMCAAAGLPLTRADEMLELVGLAPAAKRKFRGYSLGMKQRLGIASAMLGDPKALILDEPANGLDPEGIRWMRDLLKGFASEGRTVLVSSHLLSEMELLADDLVIIANGKLVTQGAGRNDRQRYGHVRAGACAHTRRGEAGAGAARPGSGDPRKRRAAW